MEVLSESRNVHYLDSRTFYPWRALNQVLTNNPLLARSVRGGARCENEQRVKTCFLLYQVQDKIESWNRSQEIFYETGMRFQKYNN